MAKIGMFWGSSTEMTSIAAMEIKKELEKLGHQIDSFDIAKVGSAQYQITKILL